MSTPTSTDLLLAFNVRDVAMRRRNNDIETAETTTGNSDAIFAARAKPSSEYVREVMAELHQVWDAMGQHVEPKP